MNLMLNKFPFVFYRLYYRGNTNIILAKGATLLILEVT
uniref:Uncharacterized protein n=1 Tax=viral metagenome TaxID=1070528 RepID=A0A6C0EAD8_9ZZZZ